MNLKCIFLSLAFLPGLAGASSVLVSPTEVYLLIGQSNMSGRGVLTSDNRVSTDRVVKWNHDADSWVEAVEPLAGDSSAAGAGLGASFARTLADKDPSTVIGLVSASVGNTALARWMPGADLYVRAVGMTRAALRKGGVLKGILWHQGCADASNPMTATNYAVRLTSAVAALRRDLNAPEVPFIAGELGRYLQDFRLADSDKVPRLARNWLLLNRQLEQAVSEISHSALVSSEGLSSKPDGVHFDTPSLRILGVRYAQALLKFR